MKELSIRETRLALSRIEEVLEAEREIVVTRHGRPIARIVPVPEHDVPTHAQLRAALPVLSPSASEVIVAERDKGR